MTFAPKSWELLLNLFIDLYFTQRFPMTPIAVDFQLLGAEVNQKVTAQYEV